MVTAGAASSSTTAKRSKTVQTPCAEMANHPQTKNKFEPRSLLGASFPFFFSFFLPSFLIFLSKEGQTNCNHQKNKQVQLFQTELEFIHSFVSNSKSITYSMIQSHTTLRIFHFSTKDSMGFSCLQTFDKCTKGDHGKCGTSRDPPDI